MSISSKMEQCTTEQLSIAIDNTIAMDSFDILANILDSQVIAKLRNYEIALIIFIHSSTGECYLGDVLENDRHGTGMILMPDRSIVYATFIHNEIHGKALHIDFPSGATRSIEYRFGVPLDVLMKLRNNLVE